MEIKNNGHVYNVGHLVAESEDYRLFLCIQKENKHQCLMQIAVSAEKNGLLDRSAYILGELKQKSDEIEEEYAKNNTDTGSVFNYDLGFPELIDSFIIQEQGNRRINVLAFRCVDDVSSVVPLINITKKDGLRVDIRTSAWIMGKVLKLLAFSHSEKIASKLTTDSNILIVPNNHYVIIFNWLVSEIFSDAIPIDIKQYDIARAAQSVITVLGGDWKKRYIPNDQDDQFELYIKMQLEQKSEKEKTDDLIKSYQQKAFDQYTDFLFRLAHGSESNAVRAHKNFYEIVDMFWKREFYPFTTKPL